MAYIQYTQCVNVKSKIYPGKPLVVTVIAAIATLAAGLGGVIPYIAIPLLLILIGFCSWWLYDRLICLGGDRCAIGLAGVVEPPDAKSGIDAFDTDYSINLVLAPHQYQELPNPRTPLPPKPFDWSVADWADKHFKEELHRQIADDGMQGILIKETSTTGDERTLFNTKSWDFEGYFSTIGGSMVKYTFQPYLHCEFEGGGMIDLLHFAEAALAFATAAAVLCAIPVIGWIACGILSAIAAVISVVGIFVALNDKAKPTVYDPVTGQTSNAVHSGQDILFVKGTWVFDTFHEGWNELHPLKKCYLVAKAKYSKPDVIDWDDAIAPYMVAQNRWKWNNGTIDMQGDPAKPADWTNWVQAWCDLDETASRPPTVTAQSLPENQWTIHPVVDGCTPDPRDGPVIH
jgi:hypothetical protein